MLFCMELLHQAIHVYFVEKKDVPTSDLTSSLLERLCLHFLDGDSPKTARIMYLGNIAIVCKRYSESCVSPVLDLLAIKMDVSDKVIITSADSCTAFKFA